MPFKKAIEDRHEEGQMLLAQESSLAMPGASFRRFNVSHSTGVFLCCCCSGYGRPHEQAQ
jgi:hypothetical protein